MKYFLIEMFLIDFNVQLVCNSNNNCCWRTKKKTAKTCAGELSLVSFAQRIKIIFLFFCLLSGWTMNWKLLRSHTKVRYKQKKLIILILNKKPADEIEYQAFS